MATTNRTGVGVSHRDYDLLKKAAGAVGAVFLLVGIAGFIPGITTNYSDLMVAGPDSDAELLGLFEVSILHNIVHLAFGVLGLFAAKAWSSAHLYPGRRRAGLPRPVDLRPGDRPRQRRQLRPGERGRQLAAPGPGRRHDRPRRAAVERSTGPGRRGSEPLT